MQQDPSFSIAAALQQKLVHDRRHKEEYERAIARVMLLADSDRNELKNTVGGVWGIEGSTGNAKYPYVLGAMQNERPSFALAMRLAAWGKKETELSGSTAHERVLRGCIATVAGIEECNRQRLFGP